MATVKSLLCQLHQNLSEALQKLLPNIFEVRSHYDLQLQNGSHKWMLSISLPLSVSFFDGCQCLCVFIFMADLLYYCVFAAKVIRQKLVNRQFPPTPTPPSPASPSLLPLLMLFRSFSVIVRACVCVFVWHLLRPPGALHPRRKTCAQETQ